jgi:hypothetical protein
MCRKNGRRSRRRSFFDIDRRGLVINKGRIPSQPHILPPALSCLPRLRDYPGSKDMESLSHEAKNPPPRWPLVCEDLLFVEMKAVDYVSVRQWLDCSQHYRGFFRICCSLRDARQRQQARFPFTPRSSF